MTQGISHNTYSTIRTQNIIVYKLLEFKNNGGLDILSDASDAASSVVGSHINSVITAFEYLEKMELLIMTVQEFLIGLNEEILNLNEILENEILSIQKYIENIKENTTELRNYKFDKLYSVKQIITGRCDFSTGIPYVSFPVIDNNAFVDKLVIQQPNVRFLTASGTGYLIGDDVLSKELNNLIKNKLIQVSDPTQLFNGYINPWIFDDNRLYLKPPTLLKECFVTNKDTNRFDVSNLKFIDKFVFDPNSIITKTPINVNDIVVGCKIKQGDIIDSIEKTNKSWFIQPYGRAKINESDIYEKITLIPENIIGATKLHVNFKELYNNTSKLSIGKSNVIGAPYVESCTYTFGVDDMVKFNDSTKSFSKYIAENEDKIQGGLFTHGFLNIFNNTTLKQLQINQQTVIPVASTQKFTM